jgi:acyl carrier protein
MSLDSRVFEIVSQVFDVPPDQVSLKTSQDTCDSWDSANIINLMIALESEFGVSFTPEEGAGLLSVELVVLALKEKGVS